MCLTALIGGGSKQAPSVAPIPAPPPVVDTTQPTPNSQKAVDDKRRAIAAAKGQESTISTGPLGVPDSPYSTKATVLGQTATV